eukprot:g3891.t1
MAATRLFFYFDCISPFSCLAHHVLQRYGPIWAAHGVEVVYRPILLGGVMAATKNLPPAARPWAKATQKVSNQDLARSRGFFDVDLLPLPSNFFGPGGPADKSGLARDLRPMRLLTAVAIDHPTRVQSVATNMFDVMHTSRAHRDAENAVLLNAAGLKEVCAKSGLNEQESDKLVDERIADSIVKDTLKQWTAEAIGSGAFGAPFFVVDDAKEEGEQQVYFGSDRFEQMCWRHTWPWFGPNPERSTSKL